MQSDFPTGVRSVNVFQKIKIDRGAVEDRYGTIISAIYAAQS
jgi:hypothetical protein